MRYADCVIMKYVATIHFDCDEEPKEDIDWLWTKFGQFAVGGVTDVHIEEIISDGFTKEVEDEQIKSR